jgi:hypothetical protein
MSRLNERDIARELAESERFEPPAGLLEKIKAEIPQEIRVGTAVPGTASRSFAPRQRWLIAASLLMGVGAGIVGMRTWQSRGAEGLQVQARVAAPRSVAAKAPPPAAPAAPAPPPPASKADDSLRGAPAATMAEEPKAVSAPAPKPETPERRDLAALGYLSNDKQGARQLVEPVEAPRDLPAPPAARAASPPALKEAEGRVENGAVGGAADAAPPAPAVAAESQAPRQKAEARPLLSQMQPLKKEKDQETRKAFAARFELAGFAPFMDAATHPMSTFGLDIDAAPYVEARRVLMEGRLPDPASVRVEEWLSAFDYDGPAPVQGDVAIRAEGSPSPFSHGPEYRLLRFSIRARQGTILRNAKAQVEFNSVVVARYRLLGASLYEIELRKDAPHWEQQVATLRLLYKVPGSGAATETLRRVGFEDFVPAWEQASPALRLTVLVAELAELLGDKPWTKQAALNDVARRIQEVAPRLPGNPKVAELANTAARAARLAAVRARPEE